MMKSHKVTGGGGVQLHVVETGNPKGPPDSLHPRLFAVWARLEPADELGPGRFVSARRDGFARHFVDALSVLTPEILSLVPGLFATDAEESERTLESFLRLFFAQEPTADELDPQARTDYAWR